MSRVAKIALVANTSWSIYNFRLGLIRALKEKGFEVILIAPEDQFSEKLKSEGFRFLPFEFHRYSTNPLSQLYLLLQFYKIYLQLKPDFIFHYTIKPNLYGTIAASILLIPSIAVTTGLGTMVLSKNVLIRLYTIFAYRISGLLCKEMWFLNQADYNFFLSKKIVNLSKAVWIPGEGIDTDTFRPAPDITNETGPVKFLFAGRLLKDKGLLEYVDAARVIQQHNKDIVFEVLGFIEKDNPNSIQVKLLEKWHEDGVIRFHGETDDIRPFIRNVDCVVLPSYREGISRILLEAASMGKPIITTNVPGCREMVIDEINGFLCEARDTESLAKAIRKFLSVPVVHRYAMGMAGRKKVEREFHEKHVIDRYLETLKKFLLRGKLSTAYLKHPENLFRHHDQETVHKYI